MWDVYARGMPPPYFLLTVIKQYQVDFRYFIISFIPNASGQPADENNVGLSDGLVNVFNTSISLFDNSQLKLAARSWRPILHLLLLSSSRQVDVPNPKSIVGRTDTAAPVCNTHRSATASGDTWWSFAISLSTGLSNSSLFGPGSPTAPYANVRIPHNSP